MNYDEKVVDTGERMSYGEGRAIREPATGKGRPSLISPELIFRVSKHLELGAQKYEPHNWEKGMPYDRVVDSIVRHTFQYLDGDCEEDHLAAIVCNAMFLMHYEKHHPELQNIPARMPKKTDWGKLFDELYTPRDATRRSDPAQLTIDNIIPDGGVFAV